jgi:hypothetical protein
MQRLGRQSKINGSIRILSRIARNLVSAAPSRFCVPAFEELDGSYSELYRHIAKFE